MVNAGLERKATAIHEAGHAVVYHHLACSDSVVIYPAVKGVTTVTGRTDRHERNGILNPQQEMLGIIAGPYMERKFYPKISPKFKVTPENPRTIVMTNWNWKSDYFKFSDAASPFLKKWFDCAEILSLWNRTMNILAEFDAAYGLSTQAQDVAAAL
jgi:hypothetical protein